MFHTVEIKPRPDQEQKDAEERDYRRKQLDRAWELNVITAVGVGVAFVAFIGLIVNAIFLHGQLKAAQDANRISNNQLTELRQQTEISERPWLDTDATPQADLSWVNGKQAVFGITFSVTNVGHSIAKDIWIAAKMFPSAPGMPVAIDAERNQEAVCNNPKMPPVGPFDLFPTSKPVPQVLDVSAGPDAIVSQAVVLSTDKSRMFVGLYVVGCANYRYSFTTDIHQTWFAYELIAPTAMLPGGRPLTLANGLPLLTGFEVGVNTPTDKIKLVPELFAQNSAN